MTKIFLVKNCLSQIINIQLPSHRSLQRFDLLSNSLNQTDTRDTNKSLSNFFFANELFYFIVLFKNIKFNITSYIHHRQLYIKNKNLLFYCANNTHIQSLTSPNKNFNINQPKMPKLHLYVPVAVRSFFFFSFLQSRKYIGIPSHQMAFHKYHIIQKSIFTKKTQEDEMKKRFIKINHQRHSIQSK